jgi:hypothetical protein
MPRDTRLSLLVAYAVSIATAAFTLAQPDDPIHRDRHEGARSSL